MKTKRILLFFIVIVMGLHLGFGQEIGIQLYSLRNQFKENIPETLRLISSWGITTIEGGENTYGMAQDEFVALLKKNGLSVASVGTNLEELRDEPIKAVERAKAFGAKYAMCPWIPHDGNTFTIKDIKNATQIFNKAGEQLGKEGIQLVYHPHGYEFRPYKEGTLFDYMASNAEHFDFEMDIYWVQHGGEDPVALLERYPDKFKLMHLKDMQKGTVGNDTGHSDVETNVILGTGMIDVKTLVLKGRELGVEYMFIEDESSRVVDQVPKSLIFLSELLN